MHGSAAAGARRMRLQQFGQLYGVALAFTLVPFSLGTDVARSLEYRLTGRLSKTLDRAGYSLLHNQLDYAVAAADEALSFAPGSMPARAIKANALFERYWVSQDESDRASGRALVDTLQDSRDAAAYTARGNRALVDGDTLGAVNALQQAVAADPTDAYAQHQLGFSLNAAGRPEEALAHFKRALELVPDIAWAQSNLLVTLVELERCDENIPGLQPAVAASCNNHLGVLRDNARRYRDARGHFERAVQAAPDSALFHANLAGTLVKLGDRGDATLHARQARTLGLSDHWVFGALGE